MITAKTSRPVSYQMGEKNTIVSSSSDQSACGIVYRCRADDGSTQSKCVTSGIADYSPKKILQIEDFRILPIMGTQHMIVPRFRNNSLAYVKHV